MWDNGEMPLYSFTPEEAGLMPLVLSIACAEGRCGECDQWFRCDCVHHRRGGEHTEELPVAAG